MRTLLTFVIYLIFTTTTVFAMGVGIIDAYNAVYLRLDSSKVNVEVESQISLTKTTQFFKNIRQNSSVKYAFPLPDQASVTLLRWKLNGEWRTAAIAGNRQDTTLPGPGAPNPNLITYVGNTPLFFSIPDPVRFDSTLIVELTYVELLTYSHGNVSYSYPGDYHLIQTGAIPSFYFDFSLHSLRTVDSIRFLSTYPSQLVANYGDSAFAHIEQHETVPDQNIMVSYTLNATQLGLFGFSTLQPDSLVPDSLGRGFVTFIAEPTPDTAIGTMSKVFTLILDRSGSMVGTKMTQAKDAAAYIVQNLNEGDCFNLIDFDDDVTAFRPSHVPYNPLTRDSALTYINGLYARNNTNISGAFDVAVPQFHAVNDSTANIIIFLTDGQPTVGIINIPTLSNHIDSLITATETRIFLFCFGIGTDANRQLLSVMSNHNNGLAEFLGNDELFFRITSFYQTIRYPVLLNSQISFNPPNVTQIYPDPLPNLYKGNQMIVAGRYSQAATEQITLSGTAFGRPVSYNYTLQLNDSSLTSYSFLPKVWAKRKIESLLIQYYSLVPTSAQAIAIRNQIIAISLAYMVSSPFTSFTGSGGGSAVNQDELQLLGPSAFELLGNYPNPFNSSTTIKLKVNIPYRGQIEIRIYNALGQVVRVLHLQINGAGNYEITWNGNSESNTRVSTGIYFYGIDLQSTVAVGKMTIVK